MHKGEIPILSIVLKGLEQIKLSPLTRPRVPDDKPNEELVIWCIRYYIYSVVAHSRTILRGLVQLIEAQNVPTALVVCRHIFEWTAHTCYMSQNLQNYVTRKEWKR